MMDSYVQAAAPFVFHTHTPHFSQGDRYLDPHEAERMVTQMLGGKPITDKAFLPCGDIPKR